MTHFFVRTLLTLAVAALSPVAHANLVTNGGFETGNFSGWVTTPAASNSLFLVTNLFPQAGAFYATFGAQAATLDSISQMLVTSPGASYDISFWLRVDGGQNPNNSFEFNWDGGVAELSLSNTPTQAYTQYTYTLTATTASTALSFGARNRPSFSRLDTIVVTELNAATVPEPTSLALVGIAALGAAASVRRTRKVKGA